MMGRGIVHPADDMSPQNAPSHPELLDELTTYFVKSGFDMRLLLQTIAITDTYARSSEAVSASEAPPELFARMAVKSLTPEQLYDAMLKVGLLRGNIDGNLNDGARNQFVTRMRTAGKDRTTFDTGMPQALALMNGPPVSTATDPNTSGILKAMSAPFLSDEQRLNVLFLAAYSREPNEQELVRYERVPQVGLSPRAIQSPGRRAVGVSQQRRVHAEPLNRRFRRIDSPNIKTPR